MSAFLLGFLAAHVFWALVCTIAWFKLVRGAPDAISIGEAFREDTAEVKADLRKLHLL